jgi:NADH-quinone oxidoreductase subunit H
MSGLLFAKAVLVLLVLLCVLVPLAAWLERRQGALAQDRIGASSASVLTATFGGLLQPLADAIKLLGKESVVPRGADRALHALAPMLVVVPVIAMVALIPFGARYRFGDASVSLVLADVDWGVLLYLALSALSGLGYVLAGWSSNSDRALLGGVRAGAQTLSCQLALALSLAPMLAIYGTLRLSGMGLVQDRTISLGGLATGLGVGPLADLAERLPLPAWGIVLNPVAFATFLLCAMAASRRPPFDQSAAGPELAGGHGIEYSGVAQGLFRLAQTVQLLVVAGVVTFVFLGGAALPWLSQETIVAGVARFYGEGFANGLCLLAHVSAFLAKLFGVVALQIVLRGSMPRLRDDQLMDWLWKGVLPLAALNLAVTGFVLVELDRMAA